MLQMHVHKKKIRAAGERSPSPPTLSKRETETERVSQGKKNSAGVQSAYSGAETGLKVVSEFAGKLAADG